MVSLFCTTMSCFRFFKKNSVVVQYISSVAIRVRPRRRPQNFSGFPDATVVSAPFGVFVADNIQKVQFAFIVNCRDEANTRHGVQRFFEWLAQTGEESLVASALGAYSGSCPPSLRKKKA